jgi:hypothetical protein
MALLGTVRNMIGEDRRKEENRAEGEERRGEERRGEKRREREKVGEFGESEVPKESWQ